MGYTDSEEIYQAPYCHVSDQADQVCALSFNGQKQVQSRYFALTYLTFTSTECIHRLQRRYRSIC